MLAEWLRTDQVSAWWGNPDEELDLISQELDESKVNHMIVSFDDKPFAFIQDCCVHDWSQDYFAPFPETARGIDTFIGRDDMIGKGHGHAYVRQHAAKLIEDGAEQVIIDPVSDNIRAINAYEKAGFQKLSEIVVDGVAIQLMVFS